MRLSLAYASLGLCVSAAHVLPRNGPQTLTFGLEAKGKVSGTVGQLSNGQNRIGGNYSVAEFKLVKADGTVFDSKHRGCVVTPPNTTQWQCDLGKAASPGWDFDCSNKLRYHHSSEFWACPVNDKGEWNIYVKPSFGQEKCTPITLAMRGGAAYSNCTKRPIVSTGTSPIHAAVSTKSYSKTSILVHPQSSSSRLVSSKSTPVHKPSPSSKPLSPSKYLPSSKALLSSKSLLSTKALSSSKFLSSSKPSPSNYLAKPKPVPTAYTKPSASPSQTPVPGDKTRGKLVRSRNGTCGPRTNYTCDGFSFGSCCSSFGWCGAATLYCGVGCQDGYGTCDKFSPKYQLPGIRPSNQKPSTSPVTSARPSPTPYTEHEDYDEVDLFGYCGDLIDDETDDKEEYEVASKKPKVEASKKPRATLKKPQEAVKEGPKQGSKPETSSAHKLGNDTTPSAHWCPEDVEGCWASFSSIFVVDEKNATQTQGNRQLYGGSSDSECAIYNFEISRRLAGKSCTLVWRSPEEKKGHGTVGYSTKDKASALKVYSIKERADKGATWNSVAERQLVAVGPGLLRAHWSVDTVTCKEEGELSYMVCGPKDSLQFQEAAKRQPSGLYLRVC